MSIKIKLKRPNGQVIPSSREIIAGQVRDALAKQGELRRFNNPQGESKEEYVVEDLNVKISGYKKGETLTKDGVIALFGAISNDAAAKKYYVGITCDPERREDEHNAEFIAVIACPNKNKANEMEKALSGEGYDAGDAVGNVHKVQSKKVYIYKKTPKTIE